MTSPRIIKEEASHRQRRAGGGSSRTWIFLGIHASQGAILSRNSHILGDLSITSLESRFCDSSSQGHPVTPTFAGFSVASHLESIFYCQLAESRDFTEIAEKLNAKNPDPSKKPKAYSTHLQRPPIPPNFSTRVDPDRKSVV